MVKPFARSEAIAVIAGLGATFGACGTAPSPARTWEDAGVRDAGIPAEASAALDAGTTCTRAKSLCDGVCVDPRTDPANCGKCGERCGQATVCRAGACVCDSPCGDACPFLATDDANCGACGQACGAASHCAGGRCRTDDDGVTNCGPGEDEPCSAAIAVPGGIVSVPLPEGVDPPFTTTYEISGFRLDKFEVTVGRFRKFVRAWTDGWRPLPGAGKHAHLNEGNGLRNSDTEVFETGWEPAWTGAVGVPPQPSDDAGVPGASSGTVNWDVALACSRSFSTWTHSAGVNERLPITCASIFELAAFCIWDGGFLPSKAEWEFAAGGGEEQRTYPWGASPPDSGAQLAVWGCFLSPPGCLDTKSIASVGSVPAGGARWGHQDMSGNVNEFVIDVEQREPPTSCVDCTAIGEHATDGTVMKGGGFGSLADYLAVGARQNGPTRGSGVGARCARMPL